MSCFAFGCSLWVAVLQPLGARTCCSVDKSCTTVIEMTWAIAVPCLLGDKRDKQEELGLAL